MLLIECNYNREGKKIREIREENQAIRCFPELLFQFIYFQLLQLIEMFNITIVVTEFREKSLQFCNGIAGINSVGFKNFFYVVLLFKIVVLKKEIKLRSFHLNRTDFFH